MKTYKYEYMIDDLCKHDFDISHMSTSLFQSGKRNKVRIYIHQVLLEVHSKNYNFIQKSYLHCSVYHT